MIETLLINFHQKETKFAALVVGTDQPCNGVIY